MLLGVEGRDFGIMKSFPQGRNLQKMQVTNIHEKMYTDELFFCLPEKYRLPTRLSAHISTAVFTIARKTPRSLTRLARRR